MSFFKLYWKWFGVFSLGFLLATIIGTQTHELGHIAVAESLGYKSTLSYGSMTYNVEGFYVDEDVITWRKMFEENNDYSEFSEAEKSKLYTLRKRIEAKFPLNDKHSLYVTIGGPAQTILTCFIGLFILTYRSSNQQENFKFIDWLAVFMSLFILREVFNTVMATGSYLINGTTSFSGDEFDISRILGFNQWTIPIMTAILGAIIASFVIFMIVPKKYRFTFILAGFMGSISGFVLWFYYLGPWLFL
ncbi:hypothetical protein [Kordia sp.]|uniref:hypothetical protein n=1 Tax=Kordia sp. TaxID=1965332 RepID=UPI003D6BF3C0